MIENICNKLTLKIRKEMPEVDDERAEVINYGLQLVIGEIPKTFVLLIIAYICGVLELSIIALLAIMPYRLTSGGVHLKTHIGCIIGTSLFYVGSSLLSKYVVIEPLYIKYILIGNTWVFSVIMIKLYAPADTEAVPIFDDKVKRKKQIVSYISFTVGMILVLVIHNNEISNILLLANFIQTLTITNAAYKITNNKHGYEVYGEISNESI